ncbi:hypothetical protein GGE08_001869 [Muricauda sp. ARW1Y1]|jgi:hypothetical protein|nr:hypothetical protein [Muricauda sp. ARW1Y1]
MEMNTKNISRKKKKLNKNTMANNDGYKYLLVLAYF